MCWKNVLLGSFQFSLFFCFVFFFTSKIAEGSVLFLFCFFFSFSKESLVAVIKKSKVVLHIIKVQKGV